MVLCGIISVDFKRAADHGHLLVVVTKFSIELIIVDIIEKSDPLIEDLAVLVLSKRLEVLNIEANTTDVGGLANLVRLTLVFGNDSNNGIWIRKDGSSKIDKTRLLIFR